jgi:hypothetical protein
LKPITAILKLATVCVLATSGALAVAAQGASADELLGDADRVIQQIDSNRYLDVWRLEWLPGEAGFRSRESSSPLRPEFPMDFTRMSTTQRPSPTVERAPSY